MYMKKGAAEGVVGGAADAGGLFEAASAPSAAPMFTTPLLAAPLLATPGCAYSMDSMVVRRVFAAPIRLMKATLVLLMRSVEYVLLL
jgi:hypothetical protein